jgi:amidase
VANGAYTMPFNLSGHPAVVIRWASPNGLPIGCRLWVNAGEMELLAIAQEIDKVIGGFQNPHRY